MRVHHYDVLIVGGGFAGLKCAHILMNSNLKILLVEKKAHFGDKLCAGGVTCEDLKYIPKKLLNFPFKKLIFFYKDKKMMLPINGKIISSINRKKVANFYLNNLKDSKNITIRNKTWVTKIIDNQTAILNSDEEIRFKFLVGADGSSSVVRKFLGLSTKNMAITIQYKIPLKFNDFEVHLHSKYFGNGYLWVFPHKNYTLIGCGSDTKCIYPAELKKNLDNWLKKRNISTTSYKPKGFIINYDYKGYRFGPVFLVGDAAGLASRITGKGIFPAFASGEQAGKEILGIKTDKNLINEWLRKKRQQEAFLIFLKNPWIRAIFYPILMKLLLSTPFSEKMKTILS